MTDPVTDFAIIVSKRMDERIREIVQAMSDGQCADEPAYRVSCGEIRAYRQALQIVEEVAKRLAGAESEK